jgi:alpha-L-rhamnosidase
MAIRVPAGWFTQNTGWRGAPFSYGDPMLRLQLVVDLKDGTRAVFGTDETWNWKEGPVIKSNLYLGEVYDARKETDRWSMPDVSEEGWNKALSATQNIPPKLLPQPIEPIRKKEVIQAVKKWKDPSGNWIFDFGVNRAGIPLLKVNQPLGTRISIRIAEEKNPDGSLNFESLGWIHHGEIFGSEYVCKGSGTEIWSPRFTYHGFRYAELSGVTGEPDESALSLVVVHTDVAQTGVFRCSDPQINRLHELALSTVLNNLHGIPTDCPNREKCGWLGDTHAYVKMANLNLQMGNFWRKYLEDIRSGGNREEERTLFHERYNNTFYFTRKEAGIPYMIAPGKRLCGVASPDWGTAFVQLQWWLYDYYGDRQVLETYYDRMKQWTDHISATSKDTARTNPYGKTTRYIVYQGLGDWCPPGGNKRIDTPIEFTSTAFHYLDVCIMEQVAGILGKIEDAKAFVAEKHGIRKEITSIYYDEEKKTFGSQTANVLALDLGLVPEGDEKAVSDALAGYVEANDGFLNTGIFGIGRIGSMLARYGHADTAWKMFTKTGDNSFGWMIDSVQVTSLWEILPVNEESRKVAAPSSLNHPMQAGFDVCFYEDMAGIRPESPGFRVIRFDPLFISQLEWAEGSIESPYGTVTSSWKNEEGTLIWNIGIPPGTSGLVALPSKGTIFINGNPLSTDEYPVKQSVDGKKMHLFPSGQYRIMIF